MTDRHDAETPALERKRRRVPAPKWRSLRTRIVAAFVIQIVAVVVAITWLTFADSQSSIEEVAGQLRDELTQRVLQKVQSYVDVPVQINENNADAFVTGLLSLDDHVQATRYF